MATDDFKSYEEAQQRAYINGYRACEERMAARKKELQTAKQKEKFMVTTDDLLNTMAEKMVKKMKEEKDYFPSSDELHGIAYMIATRTNYARFK